MNAPSAVPRTVRTWVARDSSAARSGSREVLDRHAPECAQPVSEKAVSWRMRGWAQWSDGTGDARRRRSPEARRWSCRIRAGSPICPEHTIRSRLLKDSDRVRTCADGLEILNVPNLPVEPRRGAPVEGRGQADSGGFRHRAGALVSALTTFPLPAHRTQRADCPHWPLV